MTGLQRKLTLKEGIPLAVGSIIGSGILFLPSLTYKTSSSDLIIVWLLAIFICLPGLIFFSDMLKAVPNESGMAGFVSLGLGKRIGASIPILLLSTVCLGMPAAALIAAQYVQNLFPDMLFIKPVMAFLIITFAIVSNTFGIKVSGNILKIVSFLLFAVGLILVLMTTGAASSNYHLLRPEFEWPRILSGTVLAFWAFAGFENLTFMAGEFKRPKRDLTISILVAVTVCGLLYLLLSANYAALIPYTQIDSIAGLFQLAGKIEPRAIATLSIVLFAVAAVQINFNSWTVGVSRAIYSSAKEGLLPSYFAKIDSKTSIPKRAVYLLAGLFYMSLTFSLLLPHVFETLLAVVSTNFVFIYFLAILS